MVQPLNEYMALQKQELDIVQKQLTESKSEYAKLVKQINILKDDLDVKKKQHQDLLVLQKEEIDKLSFDKQKEINDKFAVLENREKQLQEIEDNLKKQQQELIKQKEELSLKMTELEKEMFVYKQKKSEYETKISQSDDMIEAIKFDSNTSKKELLKAELLSKEAETLKQNAQQELDHARITVQNMISQQTKVRETLEKEREEMKKLIEKSNEEVKIANKDKQNAEEALNNYRTIGYRDVENARKKYEEETELTKRLQKDAYETRMQYDNKIVEIQSKELSFKNKSDDLLRKERALVDNLKSVEQKDAELTKLINEEKRQISMREEALKKQEEKISNREIDIQIKEKSLERMRCHLDEQEGMMINKYNEYERDRIKLSQEINKMKELQSMYESMQEKLSKDLRVISEKRSEVELNAQESLNFRNESERLYVKAQKESEELIEYSRKRASEFIEDSSKQAEVIKKDAEEKLRQAQTEFEGTRESIYNKEKELKQKEEKIQKDIETSKQMAERAMAEQRTLLHAKQYIDGKRNS